MKEYKVKRGLHSYIVTAETRGKAKYRAYKAYRSGRKNPKGFLPWVRKVSGVWVIGYVNE